MNFETYTQLFITFSVFQLAAMYIYMGSEDILDHSLLLLV